MKEVTQFGRSIEEITYDYEPGIDKEIEKELGRLKNRGYRLVEGNFSNKNTRVGGYTISELDILNFIRNGDFTGYWGERNGPDGGGYLGDYVPANANFRLEDSRGFITYLRVRQPKSLCPEKAPLWRRLFDVFD